MLDWYETQHHTIQHRTLAPGKVTMLARTRFRWLLLACFALGTASTMAQDSSRPWDPHLAEATQAMSQATLADLQRIDADNWPELREQWRTELAEMLGLSPWPERTPLKTQITGSIELERVAVERLHYQSRPGLYVTANLYRPRGEVPEGGWPAVLYVCGHAQAEDRGRALGNKTSYQHHGLWFAEHGVVCLTIDTIQRGEFHGAHHGTYRLGRWDWITRGYTSAGVEAWNSIRGIDLLCELPEVDPERIGVTGRSGGGVYSWFAAALDDRVRVTVPVAGITDLENHILDGCVEGHCDCMYFVNYFGWDYGKLAALVAPRGLLLANSDSDGIFPLDGVMRIHDQLRSVYRQLDASDQYGVLITPGPHRDTQELQVGAFKWLLRHLTGSAPTIDSAAKKQLEPSELAVFRRELPADEQVTSVSAWFVPMAESVTDSQSATQLWQEQWRDQLLRMGWFRQAVEAASQEMPFERRSSGSDASYAWTVWQSALDASRLEQAGRDVNRSPITILQVVGRNGDQQHGPGKAMVHLGLENTDDLEADESIANVLRSEQVKSWLDDYPDHVHFWVRPRSQRWFSHLDTPRDRTMLERRLYLLGQSSEALQLNDLLMATRWVAAQVGANQRGADSSITLHGDDRAAPLVTLAGLILSDRESDEGTSTPEPPTIQRIMVRHYPTDPLLAPLLPGMLRVLDFATLKTVAAARIELDENEFDEDEGLSAENRSATDIASHDAAGQRRPSARRFIDTSRHPQQATGMRVVEVDQGSASVWLRATRWPRANLASLPEVLFEQPAEGRGKRNRGPILPPLGTETLRHAVPGVPAEVRVGYRGGSTPGWKYSSWQSVEAETDYSALIPLESLESGTRYQVRTQVRGLGSSSPSSTLSGSFTTLPDKREATRFTLAVGTCQDFNDRDGPHGFDLYRTLLARRTDAFVLAGDVVYYDALARSVPLAHYHWQRTYGLPTVMEFHRQIPVFFLKDDHDTYVNDSWPGRQLAWTEEFSFADGQRIFRQQTGLPEPGYRTFQIGRDLQIWLMEGRDYRSPNREPDGPEKSIWGEQQLQWLRESLDASTSRFRVVISPTPLVGPDRERKMDNHANRAFAVEGAKVRQLLASYPNTISVCGDRHWQYHSVDPETGLHEFSVGPLSERHAGGWDPNDQRPDMHRFLAVAGGYLELQLDREDDAPILTLRHLDPHGTQRHQHRLTVDEDVEADQKPDASGD